MTIILCLSDEILYNVMNKETTADLWCRLESLYMTKNLSSKLFMKKQLYSLWMKEGTSILQHLNAFNRILSNLLALKVKLEGEDKTLLLLSSLPSSYDYLATTIMYGKENLELEEVRQMLQNNELRKKTFYGGGVRIVCQEQEGEDQRVGDPKEIQRLLAVFLTIFTKKPGHIKKIV